MRPLLLGLRHAHDSYGPPLDPSAGSGRRLHELSGLPLADYLTTFDRANVADHPDLRPYYHVIVLGREAWRLLGLPHSSWFTSAQRHDVTLTLIPHPSGLCRLYNDPHTRARARDVLRQHAIK